MDLRKIKDAFFNYIARRYSPAYNEVVSERDATRAGNVILKGSVLTLSKRTSEGVSEAIKRTQELADRQYQFVERYAEIASGAKQARTQLVKTRESLILSELSTEQRYASEIYLKEQSERQKTEYQSKVEQLQEKARGLELQVNIVSLDNSKLAEKLDSRNNLVAQQKKLINGFNRHQTQLVASAHHACIEDNEVRREAVFVLNHRGIITGQSKRAERFFGNMIGQEYSQLIGGSSEAKMEADRYFNPDAEAEDISGLIYLRKRDFGINRFDVDISHRYAEIVSESGQKLKARHSTVMSVRKSGFVDTLSIKRGKRKVLQGAMIKDLEDEENKRREARELAERVRRENGLNLSG